MEWDVVIGLEVHAQLATKSKIFSGASTAYGAEPNTQACAIDVAMPGMLPVLNQEAVNMAIKFGLSTHSTIASTSIFARKNYFYPDLPKGYQISQFEHPIVKNGFLDIILNDGQTKRIGVTRAHLEEDAGKSLHEDFHGLTGIDLNRAGTPLLEIVSEPDLTSAEEAVIYLKTLHSLVRYLEICDGNMQEGSFRCDANISLKPKGEKKLGTRTEIKNVNSFRYVEKAINFEISRQKEILESGGNVSQETRLYDAVSGETRAMRSKEEANDYRYFPDPDLLPLVVDELTIKSIKNQLPELPADKRERFKVQYELTDYDANNLVASKELADYFEQVCSYTEATAKLAANWVMGDLMALLNKDGLDISQSPISSQSLAELLDRISDNTISGKIAKSVFEAMYAGEGSADEIITQKGLKQIVDPAVITTFITQVIKNNPTQYEQYKAGQDRLFGFFVGQVMKLSQGKVNPQLLNQLLKKQLDS
ncbi:MAG: Asp-tRNA(Asn)/Glu-tRNA(Gln) amidotransferase GatCAB subunit B [Legionellales bacterium]|nr:Asp-tRNA(Asn)/Glu-tRNA(Gln) amidotransferase GatCAB subunit B [Legionellales bacterium]